MVKIFNNVCNQTKKFILDIGKLNNDYLYNIDILWNTNAFGECYGFKKWKNIFINDNEEFKFEQISKLFPNINIFLVLNAKPIENVINRYICKKSIKITSSLLNNLLKCLISKQLKLKYFMIYNPLNDKMELNELIKQHSKNFENNNYEIKTVTTRYAPRYDNCEVFCVIGK